MNLKEGCREQAETWKHMPPGCGFLGLVADRMGVQVTVSLPASHPDKMHALGPGGGGGGGGGVPTTSYSIPEDRRPIPEARRPPQSRLLAVAARPETAARALELYLQEAEKGGLKAINSRPSLRRPPLGALPQQMALPASSQVHQQKLHGFSPPFAPPHPQLLLHGPSLPVNHDALARDVDMNHQLDRYQSLLRECAAECLLPPAAAADLPPPPSARSLSQLPVRPASPKPSAALPPKEDASSQAMAAIERADILRRKLTTHSASMRSRSASAGRNEERDRERAEASKLKQASTRGRRVVSFEEDVDEEEEEAR